MKARHAVGGPPGTAAQRVSRPGRTAGPARDGDDPFTQSTAWSPRADTPAGTKRTERLRPHRGFGEIRFHTPPCAASAKTVCRTGRMRHGPTREPVTEHPVEPVFPAAPPVSGMSGRSRMTRGIRHRTPSAGWPRLSGTGGPRPRRNRSGRKGNTGRRRCEERRTVRTGRVSGFRPAGTAVPAGPYADRRRPRRPQCFRPPPRFITRTPATTSPTPISVVGRASSPNSRTPPMNAPTVPTPDQMA